MLIDCEVCGITHESAVERDEIHAAVKRTRLYLKRRIYKALTPMAAPVMTKRRLGDNRQPIAK